MTSPALIRSADMKRLARIAKSENVSVQVEVQGKIVTFTPVNPTIHSQADIDTKEEFSLC